MPKYAFVMLVFICLLAALAVPMTATLLKKQQAGSQALTKVKEQNEKQAPQILAERRQLKELRSAVSQANLGWDQLWAEVPTRPQGGGNLQAQIGSDNGIVDGQTLHAFQPAGDGHIYIGPFIAIAANIRNDASVLVPGWTMLQANPYDGTKPEFQRWAAGNWRFRSQIPAGQKIEFESTVKRFGTNLQTLTQMYRTFQKQEVLFKAAEAQLEQRKSELLGANDPDVKVDPLRPELTQGLVLAMEAEEEARNLLQLDIDAMRRAILDTQQEIEAATAQVNGPSAARQAPARIGSRPN
jgi:hypothetical protein